MDKKHLGNRNIVIFTQIVLIHGTQTQPSLNIFFKSEIIIIIFFRVMKQNKNQELETNLPNWFWQPVTLLCEL